MTKSDLIITGEDILSLDVEFKNKTVLPIKELIPLLPTSVPFVEEIIKHKKYGEIVYKLTNNQKGYELKKTKTEDLLGIFKLPKGEKEGAYANFKEIYSEDISSSTGYTYLIMAVVLYDLTEKLKKINDTCEEIKTILEIEKESEIEADFNTLSNILNTYKNGFNNESYIKNNHKLVLDIQRTSMKNIIVYTKKIKKIINKNNLINLNSEVNKQLKKLMRDFKYYKISNYIFSMSSYLEVMLSRNFNFEYINEAKNRIIKNTMSYRNIYCESSLYLEKIGKESMDLKVMKSLGSAIYGVGNVIENSPYLKKTSIDEILKKNGEKIIDSITNIDKETIKIFSKISNPDSHLFIDRLEYTNRVFNYTDEITFDNSNIYLHHQTLTKKETN